MEERDIWVAIMNVMNVMKSLMEKLERIERVVDRIETRVSGEYEEDEDEIIET